MSRSPRALPLISTLALWGLLAAMPQTASSNGAIPALRGMATLDVVLAHGTTVADRFCLNDGTGGLGACGSFNGVDDSRAVALGDLNNDGYPDVVLMNFGIVATDRLCLNDGAGGLASCANFDGGNLSHSVALGDINNDGHLDIAVANNGAERVCLNNGSGSFTACASFDAGANSRGIVLGDINGDGYLDAVVSNTAAAGVFEWLCLNDGSGHFASGTNCASFNSDGDNSYGVALGDVNGDGHLDAVVGNNAAVERVCLNDGSGHFAAGTDCASFDAGTNSRGIALGDVNGDGYLDAIVANNNQAESRCLNDGSGGFVSCVTFNTNDQSRGIALGDINGDGHLDVITANANSQPERLCLNDGAGNFPVGTNCTSFNVADVALGVALGKLDNDGLADVTSRFIGGVTTSNFGLTMASLVTDVKPTGLVALYQFDAKYCNQSPTDTLSNLRTRVVRITQGNALNFNGLTSAQYLTAPEWREGGIGAELVIPTAGQTVGYADGSLGPNTGTPECAVLTYKFNLFNFNKYRFAVRLYGTASAPDALPDNEFILTPGSSNDLSAVAATEIELDLGALQATTETPSASVPPAGSPPVTTPGGTAPTPVTPTTLSFPAGTSNLPSRR